ncbi:MAG TPA: hypothetical protein VJ957_00845 [Longimicrobiales bacterium]|nr:hypothetical protein [Longimicrobiales bacterium]
MMSQRDADRRALPARHVQSVSPYVNPAHVLAPPRRWLEALVNGEFSWPFFRLRYKNLLRKRYAAEPERFHALLDASTGQEDLVLTCHCVTDLCHRELAREFLERVRTQRPAAPARPQPTRRIPPAREWAHSPNPGMVLATLIEHPHTAHAAHP